MIASYICNAVRQFVFFCSQWTGLLGISISGFIYTRLVFYTALLNSIKSRKLDVFFETEEKIMGRATLERPLLEVGGFRLWFCTCYGKFTFLINLVNASNGI